MAVPQRAVNSPLLLYAICTVSARHLTRLECWKDRGEVFEYDGVSIPDLDEESAIHYHNACISYLVDISNDPTRTHNEDTLAAATALRLYEQIDCKSFPPCNLNLLVPWA